MVIVLIRDTYILISWVEQFWCLTNDCVKTYRPVTTIQPFQRRFKIMSELYTDEQFLKFHCPPLKRWLRDFLLSHTHSNRNIFMTTPIRQPSERVVLFIW